MIRHLLKVIRNERKANTWIFLEFIVVFCILWFCCDYLYYLSTCYLEKSGFDIKHTYLITMSKQPNINTTQEEQIEIVNTFRERVKHYPGVEHMAFSEFITPYSWNDSSNGLVVNEDSVICNIATGKVTPGFFSVFKIPFLAGEDLNDSDMNTDNKVIICPDRKGIWKGKTGVEYPLKEIRTIKNSHKSEKEYSVIGYVPKLKRTTYGHFSPKAFYSFQTKNIDLAYCDILIRINPASKKGFEERFMKDMKEQLALSPYYLSSIESIDKKRMEMNKSEVGDNLNSVLAITLFLIVNIFLGIIGTFWTRIQSRRSEIGLRIALGASKRKVKYMLLMETFLLLLISSIIGTIICLNIGQTDLLQALGIPLANRTQMQLGTELDVLNFGITFSFLLIVSWLAVWYPATQASNMAPYESLRSE